MSLTKSHLKRLLSAQSSNLTILTKALQKLKDLKLLSKKRSLQDERTVIVYVTDTQKANIQKLISELEEYIKN